MAARYFIDSRFTIFTLLMLSLPHASDSAERMIHHDPLHAGWAGPASLSTSRRGAEVGKPLRDGERYLFEKRRAEGGATLSSKSLPVCVTARIFFLASKTAP